MGNAPITVHPNKINLPRRVKREPDEERRRQRERERERKIRISVIDVISGREKRRATRPERVNLRDENAWIHHEILVKGYVVANERSVDAKEKEKALHSL